MSSDFDLFSLKSIGNIFLPWVVHVCDMVTLHGKGNDLEPGNHCVYRRTDNQDPVYITFHNFVAVGKMTIDMYSVWYSKFQ
jgi:hypothetical protein